MHNNIHKQFIKLHNLFTRYMNLVEVQSTPQTQRQCLNKVAMSPRKASNTGPDKVGWPKKSNWH